jgi:hypothetical protein
MFFQRGDRRILWKGIGSLRDDIREPALHAVADDPQQPLLDRLLQQYRAIFDEPRELPPAHPYDHWIHLLPGTAPVAVHPYWYLRFRRMSSSTIVLP